MAVAFKELDLLGRSDLNIFLRNSAGNPTNAFLVTYSIHFVDPGPPEVEVLLGAAARVPINPAVGEYYASLVIPAGATVGTYRIRWIVQETVHAPQYQIVQEFAVVGSTTQVAPSQLTQYERNAIRSLRIQLRDNNPDKNYKFRPPEFEGKVGQYNQVFGQIWEDEELKEYIDRSLDWFNMFPPATTMRTLDNLMQERPACQTAILWGAVIHACFALSANWVADEFSVSGDTLIRVRTSDGEELDVPIEDLYRLAREALLGAIEVQSASPSGEVRWSPVKNIMRHNTEGKLIYHIEAGGASIDVTEDHSLFTTRENKLVPTQASELAIDSELVFVLDGRVVTHKITAIQEMPPLEHTYDLCVPGDENFVCSNGMLAHNSYSIGGISLDIEKSSKYESLKQGAETQFDKAIEAKLATFRYTRGLIQPRYGIGVRSSFGPRVGAGVLSPRSYLGF